MYTASLTGMAHHEAGHIATLTEYGIEIYGANIVPKGNQYGAVQHENLFWGAAGTIDRCDECFARSLRHMTVLLSGPVAEATFDPAYKPNFKHADYQESLALARFHCQDVGKAARLYEYLWSQAERIVGLRWRQVEAVANALVERSSLTGSEIQETLAGASPRRRSKRTGSLDPLLRGPVYRRARYLRDGGCCREVEIQRQCSYARPSGDEEALSLCGNGQRAS